MLLRSFIVRKRGGRVFLFVLPGVNKTPLRVGPPRNFMGFSGDIYPEPSELGSCSHACNTAYYEH
jgi:hypothetical protein